MAKHCSKCAYENPDNSVFCIRCGNNLELTSGVRNPPSVVTGSPAGYGSSSVPPSYGSPPPVAQPAAHGQAMYSPLGNVVTASGPGLMQMGTVKPGTEGEVTIRRAFAGHGTPISNYSWLLSGDATKTPDILMKTLEILQQRSILGMSVNPTLLKERGVQMEEREYIEMRRGVATTFIYIASAGRDLYISRTTTVQPAINVFRVILLVVWLGIALFGPAFLQTAFSGFLGLLLAGMFSFVNFLFFWLPLIIFAIRSTIHFVLEKDFWVYLRSRDLNDFQLDDISVLEHITDDTLKEAVKQVGLDASKIAPPQQGYQQKRKITAI